jgi:hypothetical protein
MGLFKKATPAYKEFLEIGSVLGQAIAQCHVGHMPPDYLEFTIQGQAPTFRARLEAYGTEIGNSEKAWTEAEKHVVMIAGSYMSAVNARFNKARLAQEVTEVLMLTMAASAAAGNAAH